MKILSHSESNHFTKSERQSLVLLAILLLLGGVYVMRVEAQDYSEETVYSKEEMSLLLKEMTDSRLDHVYEGLDLKGQAVFILNTTTDEPLYARNSDTVMPLASLAKIMTAVIALEQIPEDEVISIPAEALRLPGDNGLLVDEKWGRDDLVRFMLITSSNDAARALALFVGKGSKGEGDPLLHMTALMNQKADELLLSQTEFFNESGLDVSPLQGGGYGTPREVVQLFDYAITKYPHIFTSTAFASENFVSLSEKKHTAQNTNTQTGSVAGISASKTGFTNISGGNLIISFHNARGETIIATVLGSTFVDRFTDIEKVAGATLRFMNEVE